MYNITKEFDFCYGHRVHNQTLNKDYSIDSCLVCRHIHGHQGKIIVNLTAEELTNDMITDFKHLNWFKKWIDDEFDHKFIIDKKDPALSSLFPLLDFHTNVFLHIPDRKPIINLIYGTINMNLFKDQPKYIQEIYEGLVIVEFVPTSENLSRFFYDMISIKMSELGIQVKSVIFKETPKTSAEYSI